MFRNPSADVLIVLVIVLLFFGPKRLPGLGKSLGSGIREFKDSITGGSSGDDEQDDAQKPALTPGATGAVPPSAPAPPAAAAPPAGPAQGERTGVHGDQP
jgi:sec-independent protein translocase protein TatA